MFKARNTGVEIGTLLNRELIELLVMLAGFAVLCELATL